MESSRKDDATGPHDRASRLSAEHFSLEAFASVLTQQLSLSPDVPLYIAYSGGMDSHVLLHAAACLRNVAPWHVQAIHIDHGLHPGSAKWSEHCARVCRALDVALVSERVSVTDVARRGREDAARQARYQALARRLPPGAVLLTAHHQNDQAETVLLQLLRGGGVAGLAAMPAIAPFGNGRLARPLLGFERRALAAYAQTHALQWVEDASNRDETLARNYMRHRVWPAIVAHWPHAAEQLALVARYQAQAAELIDERAAMDLQQIADSHGGIRLTALAQLTPVRQTNALRFWLRQRGLSAPAERVLAQILRHVRERPRTQHALIRWGEAQVRLYRDRLVAGDRVAPPPQDWEAAWDARTTLEVPGGAWRLRVQPSRGAGLALAKLGEQALRVRLRQGGESLRLRGHRHKVKKLLQEAGVPPWERACLPLVYVRDELAAVGDRWVSDDYAAKADEPSLRLVLEHNAAR